MYKFKLKNIKRALVAALRVYAYSHAYIHKVDMRCPQNNGSMIGTFPGGSTPECFELCFAFNRYLTNYNKELRGTKRSWRSLCKNKDVVPSVARF